jgi:hypothetical protein
MKTGDPVDFHNEHLTINKSLTLHLDQSVRSSGFEQVVTTFSPPLSSLKIWG